MKPHDEAEDTRDYLQRREPCRAGRLAFRGVDSGTVRTMNKRRNLIVPAIVLGAVLLVIAIIYIADPAKSLPSFFPGHEAGSTHHHVKHGIAAFVVALGCFIFAWFQTGPAGTRERGAT